jgi:hypothetical protein
MTARCPSDLALEVYLLDRATSKLSPHVGSCATCQSRVARMEQQGQEFLQYVFPATVGKIEEAAGEKRSHWRRWLMLAPVPLAGLAAALLLVAHPASGPSPLGPDESYIGIKGGSATSLGLSVFLGAAEGARLVNEGEPVPATSALRFKVQPTKACRLWMVSVDAAGQVSRLYPATGDEGAELSQGGALPGGAVLDGRSGPERIFAFCTPKPVKFAQVQRAVRNAVGPGANGVRATIVVPGFPDGTSQATMLIEKKP